MTPSRRGRNRNRGGRTAPVRAGSRTVTITGTAAEASPETGTATAGAGSSTPAPVLKLRRRRRVRWSAETHDNEHDGRKTSKSCCIFHKSRAWDESSSESGEDRECRDMKDRREDGDLSSEHHGGGSGNDSSSSGGPVRQRPNRGRPLPQVEDDGDDDFFE